MTKVKAYIKETKIIETNFDYPIYLYFQDEDCHDELIKINESNQISVKYDYSGVTINKTTHVNLPIHYLNSMTTKEHFDEIYKNAIEEISKYTK